MPRRRWILLSAFVASGCSAHAATPWTAAPTTTATTTSTTTTADVATTTIATAAPSTSTTVSLPTPLPPPLEDGTTEPVIDIGTIEIPAIDLIRPVGEGIRLRTLDRGPGHWPGTAMPGQMGNVVIAGHRVSYRADFRHLDRLTAGDAVVLTTEAGRFVYTVAWTQVVAPDAIWVVDQTAEHTATLLACHPPGSLRERIVVHLTLAT